MLITTNVPSLIATTFMLLSFVYNVFSLSINKNWMRWLLSFILLNVVAIVCYLVYEKGFICLLSIMLLNVLLLKNKRQKLLEYMFITLYFIFLKLLSYVIVTWMMNLMAYEVLFPIYYTIYLSDVLLCVFLLLTCRLLKEYMFRIREYSTFYTGVHIVLILLYLSYLVTIFKKGELLLESAIEIFLVTILVFLMYKVVSKVLFLEKESYLVKLHNEELKFNQKNYHQLMSSINEIRTMKHDMNHFLLSLLDCYQKKEYDEMYALLKNQLNLINEPYQLINTGNESLNLILSSQMSKLKDKNIEFICNAFDDVVHIDKVDFYTLLGNLLDNAIENCTSQSVKKILLDIYCENNCLYINIKNTSLINPLVENPYFHTKKHDASNHGLGMHTIERIVHKYEGDIVYDYSYHYFIVHVKLVNNYFSKK